LLPDWLPRAVLAMSTEPSVIVPILKVTLSPAAYLKSPVAPVLPVMPLLLEYATPLTAESDRMPVN
jgi:hypothetical protein